MIANFVTGLVVVYVAYVAFVYQEIKRRSPHRPFFTSVIDAVVAPLRNLRIGLFGDNSVRYCMKLAEKATGLSDFGNKVNDNYIKRYEIARKVGLEESKMEYTPGGFYMTGNAIVARMTYRLELVDYMKRHPIVSTIKIDRPVFVTGFPRTGTTYLHELLSLHPNVIAHRSWHQISVIPKIESESFEDLKKDLNQRYKDNRFGLETKFWLAGDAIQRVHRLGYDETEECTMPMAVELPYSFGEIPWIPFTLKDILPLGTSFVMYKQYLQLLSFQMFENCAGQKDLPFSWMLKSPFHLPYLTELFEEFPDATVVWTHRNPIECIASACSLYETFFEMFAHADSIDRHALGKAVLEYSDLSLNKAKESLEKLGLAFTESSSANKEGPKVIHIKYQDTVKKSKKVCKEVFSFTKHEYSSQYDEELDRYIKKSTEEREKLKTSGSGSKKFTGQSLYEYKLEDYGLTEQIVRDKFKWYIDAFKLDEK